MTEPHKIPTDAQVKAAGKLKVLDNKGQEVTFSSIIEEQRTIVVFIRHFFCGRCEEYVQALTDIPQEKLDAVKTKIVVVGCGDWQPIDHYVERNQFEGPIYADPTRKLYRALGMNIERLTSTPAGVKEKSYIRSSKAVVYATSIWNAVLHPFLKYKGGNIAQLGGEFVFGPGTTCSFASRMEHTEDHVEVDDLLKAVGA